MEHVWRHYNALPSLSEANQRFSDRATAFAAVEALFAKHPEGFGLCLIHTHCALTEGEIMLAFGAVSQPVPVSAAPEFYPERWLPSGEPFEFTTKPTTKIPSAAFLEDFRATFGSDSVLGLCVLDDAEPTDGDGDKRQVAQIEWTEGRKNKVREVTEDDMKANPIPTSWTIGDGIVTMTWCNQYCPSKTTESGSGHLGMERKVFSLAMRL
jgi:hypothetical protein